MTMEGMAPEDILRMEQEAKMGEEMDKEAQEKIALLLIGFQAELSEAKQLDPTHYFVDKAVNQAVLGTVDKIISTVEELGYRKIKDKPPLFDKDDEARIKIAEYMLVPDPLSKVRESYIACFLLGCQVQWDVCVEHYEG